jgi:predicted transcriptional regulator
MTLDLYMKRTTIYLTGELDRLLYEAARRAHRPRAEIVRDALTQYFEVQHRPWPRSLGMGQNADHAVTSENVKDWLRERSR